MPQLMHTFCSSPCYKVTDQLASFDYALKMTSSVVCNFEFDDVWWKLATLPIYLGGIGMTISIDTALSTYAMSFAASPEQTGRIISKPSEYDMSSGQEAVYQSWTAAGFDLVVHLKMQRCSTRIAAVYEVVKVISTP